jgi:hypothetical protein
MKARVLIGIGDIDDLAGAVGGADQAQPGIDPQLAAAQPVGMAGAQLVGSPIMEKDRSPIGVEHIDRDREDLRQHQVAARDILARADGLGDPLRAGLVIAARPDQPGAQHQFGDVGGRRLGKQTVAIGEGAIAFVEELQDADRRAAVAAQRDTEQLPGLLARRQVARWIEIGAVFEPDGDAAFAIGQHLAGDASESREARLAADAAIAAQRDEIAALAIHEDEAAQPGAHRIDQALRDRGQHLADRSAALECPAQRKHPGAAAKYVDQL